MTDIKSFPSFEAATQATLKFLHSRLGLDLWMLTRTEGEDWIVLHSEDHGYGVKDGAVFRWADSFCSRMTRGLGPRIAPRSGEVPAYVSAPIGQQVAIGAYVGIPLTREDGSLFGTLCAIDPNPQPPSLTLELPLVELVGRLLCSVLESELKLQLETRRAERALADSFTDPLTGLYNRRAWNHLTSAEEERCRRYGHPACVLSIDLDGLKQVNDGEGHAKGDEYICRAANAIRGAVRLQDIVARIGGDEFAVLGVECDSCSGATLSTRISLEAVQVPASIGLASRDPRLSLSEAFVKADEIMYCCKRSRKNQSPERDLEAQGSGLHK
jgi:diguanylate cyclase